MEPVLAEQWMSLLAMALESDNEGMTAADYATSTAQVAAAGTIPMSAHRSVGRAAVRPAAGIQRVKRRGAARDAGHAALARTSSKGQHRVAGNASQQTIPTERDLIADAIRQVVVAVAVSRCHPRTRALSRSPLADAWVQTLLQSRSGRAPKHIHARTQNEPYSPASEEPEPNQDDERLKAEELTDIFAVNDGADRSAVLDRQ